MAPLVTAAAQLAVTLPSPRVAVTLVGALGIAIGVTELEAIDAADVPAALVAVAVKV